MLIRHEQQQDHASVYQLNSKVFDTVAEAGLVDALRQQANPCVSLVAVQDSQIIGHIFFSPVTLSNHSELNMMGLAPMAVLPEYQRQGIGSALVRAGLEHCYQLGCVAVAVLGHPEYYPKFGFQPSVNFNVRSEYEVPDDVCMLLELTPGTLSGRSGKIKYHQAFGEL